MIKLAISGCLGRMGQRITELASSDKEFRLATLLENPHHPQIQKSIQGVPVSTDPSALKGSDVLIEFTTPEATLANLKFCAANGINMVIGTTGLTKEQNAEIQKASQRIAVVYSSNMSVGVNILFLLAKIAGSKIDSSYNLRIVEAHHIHKKDSPSGTAKTLAEYVQAGAGRPVEDIQAIREGEIIGDHELILESPVDRITITHHAKTRDIFAQGSLVAAKFLTNKKTGLFNMQDVLGIKEN